MKTCPKQLLPVLAILSVISVVAALTPVVYGVIGMQPVQMLRSMRFGMWLEHEPEPVSKGDAPRNKTVLILSPFSLMPDASISSEDEEVIKVLTAKAAHAGFTLEGGRTYLNQAVTIKVMYDTLLKSPGVIYFSTHGGLNGANAMLSSGEPVPSSAIVSEQATQRYLRDQMRREFGNTPLAAEILPTLIITTPDHDKTYYISVTTAFFELLKRKGANFSTSLFFLDGCEVAKDEKLRAAINAKAFLGWVTGCNPVLSNMIGKYYWECLALKTRSDREAYDYAVQRTADNETVKIRIQRKQPGWTPANFKLFRRGRSTPEKWFEPVHRQMMMAIREYVCRNPQINTLDQSVTNLANKRDKEIGKNDDAYYNQAFASGRPTEQQLDEVRGELCGFKDGSPRFTMIEK